MRYFVFSDVHGCLSRLTEALRRAGYNPADGSHKLLFLGDAFDKKSPERDDFGVYEFLQEGIRNKKLIWVLGNHDTMLVSVIRSGKMNKQSEETVRALAQGIARGLDPAAPAVAGARCLEILKAHGVDLFIEENGLDYFETERYVFTHGIVPMDRSAGRYDPDWRNEPAHSKTWNGCRSGNGMELGLRGIRIPDKILVCGHVGTYYGHLAERYPNLPRNGPDWKRLAAKVKKTPSLFGIYEGDGVIGVDGNCHNTGVLNVLVVDDVPV